MQYAQRARVRLQGTLLLMLAAQLAALPASGLSATVGTIVALGESLGLAAIAEGVETAAQRDMLATSGCCLYQGYLFSRPVPAAELEAGMTHNP